MRPPRAPSGPGASLVQAVLHPDPAVAGAAGRRYLDQVDLQLIPWPQARLLPLLYKRMAAVGEPTPPLLRGTYRKAWTQNQLRFRATMATVEALDRAGIRTLVLKGASLVPAYGGDWGVRDMTDVDLLVDPARLDEAAAVVDAAGWRPTRGLTTAGVLARHRARRHSWNFAHPDGHQLDLHWRVFAASRSPRSDRAFFEAAVPLELGPVRAWRMADPDLLLHVLEHAGHGEQESRLLWIVDAVVILRAIGAAGGGATTAAGDRLAAQARAHRLLRPVRERLQVLGDVVDEPVAAALLDRLRREPDEPEPIPGTWRARLDEHRRGGTPLPAAAASLAREVVDGSMAPRRAAWLAYVATGRRPSVEAALVRRGGRLTATPSTEVPPPGPDGFWHLDDGPTVEALCGPGWSYPEPGTGTWVEGVEGRLSLPRPNDGVAGFPLVVDVVLTVLGRHGGPDRRVEVRAAGRTLATIDADEASTTHEVRVVVPTPAAPTVELSILARPPARPIDLGVGLDDRRLSVLVHRVRARTAELPAVAGATGGATP